MTAAKFFSQSEIQAIADALGDTDIGLTGTEIGQTLRVAQIPDPDPSLAKRHRLLNAFAANHPGRLPNGPPSIIRCRGGGNSALMVGEQTLKLRDQICRRARLDLHDQT